MTTAEESLKDSFTCYGILFLVEGLLLLFLPHAAVGLMQLSPLDTEQAEQYTRIAGLLLCVVGCHYVIAGLNMFMPFFIASILARPLVLPTIALFVLFGSFEWPLIFIGIQDLLGSYWSFRCLKSYEREDNRSYTFE